MPNKPTLFGIVVVALAALLFFAVGGFPPAEDGAEGTIGVAQRTQTEQINAADVVLEDEDFQKWMQSDDVQRMIADEDFTTVMASPDFQAVLASPDF